ncbi:hypothetical protein SJAV_18910 [Sulfurisphaera javensis]|uniref:Uncharacterized protein n=1 Tax=Sulfurisphaera javensis TaxID=2049879 RepID=A0AAT9GT03_9CREN
MNGEIHNLVLLYIVYIIIMTITVTISFEFALKNKLGYLFLLMSYITTVVFLVLVSPSDLILTLLISVYFWLIMQLSYNLGKYKFAIVSSLIFQEIVMSLLYYAIVRNNLTNALYSLYFYGTDIPSFSLSISQIVVPAILEVVNSFMFFLMIFPEIAYLSYKFKNRDILLLSLLIFAGPNIASEMTHSILPLSHDPINEASVLELLLSLFLSVYFSYRYIKGKISLFYYLLFGLITLSLSVTEFYYSLTINEIPYALITLVSLSILFYYVDRKSENIKVIPHFTLIPSIAELFFGASVAYFYNLIPATYALSFSSFIISLIPTIYYYFSKFEYK